MTIEHESFRNRTNRTDTSDLIGRLLPSAGNDKVSASLRWSITTYGSYWLERLVSPDNNTDPRVYDRTSTCRAARSSSAPSPITTYVHLRPYRCTTRSKHDSFDEPAAAVAAAEAEAAPADLLPPVDEPPPPEPAAEYTFSTAKCGPSPYNSTLARAGIRCVVVTSTLTQLGLRAIFDTTSKKQKQNYNPCRRWHDK